MPYRLPRRLLGVGSSSSADEYGRSAWPVKPSFVGSPNSQGGATGHKKDISNRRTFLKTAGAAAGTVLLRNSLWAQRPAAEGVSLAGAFPTINPKFMMTPDQAWEWNAFKSQGGPTYAGGAGWKRFTDFLIGKMPELGAVDLDFIDIPYDHYIVDDSPDRRWSHRTG